MYPQTFQGDSLEEKSLSIWPISSSKEVTEMQGIFDALATVGTAAVGATMVLGLFAGASLQAIWSLFDTQQLSIHYLILNVTNIPSNAFAF